MFWHKQNQQHLEGHFRSTNPKYLRDNSKSVNITFRVCLWIFLTVLCEGVITYLVMHYSIDNSSWETDGYITTAGSIGAIVMPIAIFIGELLW